MAQTRIVQSFRLVLAVMLAVALSLTSIVAVNAQQGQQVQLGELLRNTDEFVGQDVTVTGPVGEEIARTAFTLTTNGRQILVVGDRQAIPSNLADEVLVSGAVQETFQVSEVEDQLGVNLNQQAFAEFEGNPFILADQVQAARQQGQAEQVQLRELIRNTDQYVGQTVQVTGRLGRTIIPQMFTLTAAGVQQQGQVQLNELLQNPDEFFGQDVTVTGPVGEELDREAFTITVDGQEVLVVGDRQAIPSNLADEVLVSGVFQEALDVQDIENELGVTLNQDVQQFEGDPFILADQVQAAGG